MDALDQKLLDLLTRDARMSLAMLARRLDLARSTVQYRLERLERSGAIGGYTIRPGAAARGPSIEALVLIAVEPRLQAAVEKRLGAIAAVRRLLSVSGSYDLAATLTAKSAGQLDLALDEVRNVPGIRKTVSAVVLSARLDRGT
jgi:DNA-binding Lrp family transcriptional regulator